jgi:cytochrome c biogenesis protein CcdA
VLTVLAVAAFLAGVTGSWSPCGFSMVTTLGPTGHEGGRRLTAAALAAFAPGALLGGVVTFAGLAALGSVLGGGTLALGVAAVVAGAGALLELAGVPIAPQVRRQVPEHWRRVLPLPVAAGLYGVLLGLGFTTFVLTFAVPVLAAIALAVGDVGAGLAMGLAFGAGRLLPIVLLAPLADRPAGWRATELMAERPLLLRGFRVADALALAAVALTLGAQSASAQVPGLVSGSGTDPSVAGTAVAWRDPVAGTALVDGRPVPGASHVALGGRHVATLEAGRVVVRLRATGAVVRDLPAPAGIDALAVSARWLVLRTRGTTEALTAVRLADGRTRTVRTARSAALGRPALDRDLVVFHLASEARSAIEQVDLATGRRRALRTARRAGLSQPAVLGPALVYVATDARGQHLRLGRRREETGRRDRSLLRLAPSIRADRGVEPGGDAHGTTSPYPRPAPAEGPVTTLWTTALAADAAYVTRLVARPGGGVTSELVRVAR